MATKDEKYQAYLEAYATATFGQRPNIALGAINSVVFAALIALAVRHAKDNVGPVPYSEFVDAMKKLGVLD